MLTYDEAKRIGINACIDRIGREFCLKNKDYSCSWYADVDEYAYCGVGVSDEKSYHPEDGLVLTAKDDWLYMASCNVWYEDGRIEYLDCRVPELV